VKPAIRPVLLAIMLMLGCLPVAERAAAQEKTGALPGFTLAPAAKILLLRPRVRIGAQSTGGMFEPNVDWTEQARANISAALDAQQAQSGNRIFTVEEPVGDDAQKLADYRALFSVLAYSAAHYQLVKGDRLPTKKRNGVFEWSVGPEVRDLPGAAGADYVLFFAIHDQYGSTGRKMAQIAAAFAGASVTSGVHMGFAALIDLKTGNLVWLNIDDRMGGDVRTPDGAQRRVAQLLEGLPIRTPPAATAVIAAGQ
jgi:hypothetical protein